MRVYQLFEYYIYIRTLGQVDHNIILLLYGKCNDDCVYLQWMDGEYAYNGTMNQSVGGSLPITIIESRKATINYRISSECGLVAMAPSYNGTVIGQANVTQWWLRAANSEMCEKCQHEPDGVNKCVHYKYTIVVYR